jgi:preprotein translocase subunit SecG
MARVARAGLNGHFSSNFFITSNNFNVNPSITIILLFLFFVFSLVVNFFCAFQDCFVNPLVKLYPLYMAN